MLDEGRQTANLNTQEKVSYKKQCQQANPTNRDGGNRSGRDSSEQLGFRTKK